MTSFKHEPGPMALSSPFQAPGLSEEEGKFFQGLLELALRGVETRFEASRHIDNPIARRLWNIGSLHSNVTLFPIFRFDENRNGNIVFSIELRVRHVSYPNGATTLFKKFFSAQEITHSKDAPAHGALAEILTTLEKGIARSTTAR